MSSLLAAFQFLTIFPTLIKRMFTSQEMGRAVAWFPLVGVALGFLLYGVNTLAQLIFPASVSAALTVFAWIIFTRAFHLDGFMDTCDGLFGGFTPERRLEIMKDSRMGAFGTIGGALVLLTEYTALHSSVNLLSALLLATTLGRWASPLVIYFFPYAREEGLGIEMKRNVRLQEVLVATLIAGVTSWFAAGGWLGLVLMLGAAIIAFIVAWYAMRLLHGLTGDIYGTVTTTVEMFILLIFTIS
ncbi:MAG TPA: adenosylcobinamide-GDP ribazoletransferase [Anaerolineales bacterium]|jgi:adenosylcobinamide-GDP ribazoletransferase|nr:adenosylcobinamide-GDP ribazoletransferase [Anaerolineales bacterium]